MTKHEYICAICEVVASKATCLKLKVGSVFVSPEYEILATGYNGAPRGLVSCERAGECELDGNGKCIRCTHAEMNAIVQAAKRGTALLGSFLYITHSPCRQCANAIVNLGARIVFYRQLKGDGLAVLNKAGIKTRQWTE